MFTKPKVKRQVVVGTLSVAVLCVFFALEAAAQTGAARDAFKGSAELRNVVARTASSIDDYARQIEKVDRSLERLSRSGNGSRGRYQSFAKELRKLEKAQKNAASRIETMRARETEYFSAWDKAHMQIADPELRRAAAVRRSEVMSKYQVLADDISAIGRGLQPLMSHLRDLDLFLGADQSRGSINEASSTIAVTRAEIRTSRHEIAGVQRMLKVFLNETLPKS